MEKPSDYPESIFQRFTHNVSPRFPTNLLDLEARAKSVLPPKNFWFGAGGCSTEATVSSNRTAFDRYRIVPRMLTGSSPHPDLSRTIFGHKLHVPIVMTPIGVQSLYHHDAEKAVSKVFGAYKLPFCLSTVASVGLKAAAEANGNGNPLWFQLYLTEDEDLTASILKGAKEKGYTVLVVTVDTWVLAWRPHDLDTGYMPFLKGNGTAVLFEDAHCKAKLGFDPTADSLTQQQRMQAALYHAQQLTNNTSPTWERVRGLRKHWDGPIVIKGIQSVVDARLAVSNGFDGIVVSNHGGRQIDGAVGSLQVLREIVEAVGGKITIGFDSGIRCGADVFKAIALGADYVAVGRPIIWGLALGGEEGVEHVLKCIGDVNYEMLRENKLAA